MVVRQRKDSNTTMLDSLNLRQRGHAAAQKAKMRVTQPSSWKLPKQPSSIAPPHVWTNVDMDPVPPERRTWGKTAFVTYWFSDLVTISTWSSGSAIITLGECHWTTLHSDMTNPDSQVSLPLMLYSSPSSPASAMLYRLCSTAPLVPTCTSRSLLHRERASAIGLAILLL